MMIKKKKHKLRFSGSNPYKLLGISSHENDYRLSWAANSELGLKFRKSDSFFLKINDAVVNEFSLFQCDDEDNSYRMNLISNRCPNGFLIKELKNIDYFLQIFGEISSESTENLITGLRKINIVSAVFEIAPAMQKKAWNLPLE